MRITTHTIKEYKKQKRKIIALTAYDYSAAKVLDNAGVDVILVGDSLAQVALGYENTLSVTINEMLHHAKAVVRGVKNSLVVVDLPFLSYQVSKKEAIYNAGKCLQIGAQAVKLEGASEDILKTIKKMVSIGVPVMGHIGFTPQSVNALGGNRVQGKTADHAEELLKQAKDLQSAGCFAIVLEMVPSETANLITENLDIPTIGIGAGLGCDGQILVTDDLLGKYVDFKPSFVRRYAEIGKESERAVKNFIFDVQNGKYPGINETFYMSECETEKLCQTEKK
ncbi:MAG: 3-methyl-2-oxobutanoate hydroxymethyltransferase [Candidatus Melainabacteria bacterium RIFCSPLOWO2_02_FULL_35_15]|nr:MAG: 3-methyl-2-oxobutanoate hydroxymethyltransferase [Candidatus Melainabacteria bacterium RIFCSPLOWO2_12_FULL_35_11]OGI13544.1 MAG: 3-methyl-2-oxobutanoate hydroxymethyltransferase [Candidatus Melainabacteria bacterium RIFCSPLOWO2_02_FULL_35_15]